MKFFTTVLLIASLITSCSSLGKEVTNNRKALENNAKTITGFLILSDYESVRGSWNSCEGTGGYSDIDAGSNVSIENEDGKVISAASWRNLDEKAVTLLAENEIVGSEVDTVTKVKQELADLESIVCVLYFQADLQGNSANIYQIKTRRGEMTYTEQQLQERDYVIVLSLGD